jgi:hypothetical protein
MAITNGYATLEQLVQLLGTDAAQQATHTALLEDSITRASRLIDTITDTFFFKKPIANEVIDRASLSDNLFKMSNFRKRITAPAPIIAVTEIKEDGIVLSEKTTFNGPGDFVVRKVAGELSKVDHGLWSLAELGIEFSGDIGYDPAPADIESACLVIAAVLSTKDNKIVVDETGNEEEIVNRIIPTWQFEKLQSYKRHYI